MPVINEFEASLSVFEFKFSFLLSLTLPSLIYHGFIQKETERVFPGTTIAVFTAFRSICQYICVYYEFPVFGILLRYNEADEKESSFKTEGKIKTKA